MLAPEERPAGSKNEILKIIEAAREALKFRSQEVFRGSFEDWRNLPECPADIKYGLSAGALTLRPNDQIVVIKVEKKSILIEVVEEE